MHVLIVTNLFPPYILGGYEILCGQVCRKLLGRGHRISVLTSGHGVATPASDHQEDEQNVHRILGLYEPFDRPARLSRSRRRATHRRNYEVTRQFLRTNPFDVAFVWSQLRLTLGAARAAQDAGVPTAYTFNDPHPLSHVPAPLSLRPRGFVRYLVDHFLYSDITIRGLRLQPATCISQCLKTELLAGRLPIPDAEVIYQGIPLERFPVKQSPGAISSPLRILYAGQLHPYKGVHTLVRAVGLYAENTGDSAPRLTIAGDGPEDYKRQLRETAERLKAPVTFLGRVPHDELPALYRAHDVFVFPSEWPEPFGLTHLEAMASGTPVISTTEGGHGEFLEDRRNCLAFPKGNAEALAERLQILANSPSLARNLAEGGRRVVEERLNLDHYVAQLEVFLQNTIAQGAHAS